MTKVLLIDGTWLLKRNYHKRNMEEVNGEKCGGSYGFLDSLRAVINKVFPDKVIVMWDGLNSGYLRYEIYKPYKANRKKSWTKELNAISTEGIESQEDKELINVLERKFTVKNFLEELCIKHLEIDLIEADDLIGYYILNKKISEKIIIYSRDGDYPQLVSADVSVLNPDNLEMTTIYNFKKVHGYIVENALLFKCFSGDKSDKIEGVKGVTINKLLEEFPRMAEEKYTYNRLVEECYEKKKTKKIKFYDKIIGGRDVLYRNAQLMNLKKPFINEEVKSEMQRIMYEPIERIFSTESAMNLFIQKGFTKFVRSENLSLFFAPFFSVMANN